MAAKRGAGKGASGTAEKTPRASTKAKAPDAEAEQPPQELEQRSIRPLDFSQPSKFTTELRRKLTAGLAGFCTALAESLTEELHCEVSLEPADVAQHTWAAAKARLAADAPAIPVKAGPPQQQMLLSVEMPWLAQTLECLLGGQAAQAVPGRNLSEIDWALAEDLLDEVVSELSAAWQELGGGELHRGEVDLEGDGGLLTVSSEPTLSVTVASTIDGCRSSLVLLVPWPCVEPLVEGLRDSGGELEAPAGGGARELQRGLAEARVLLRAEVGSVQMPIERMRTIEPGSVLSLDQRAQDGVRLFAEAVSLGRGRPGASANRRAIKLETIDETPIRSETYASLGRVDIERARAVPPPVAAGERARLSSIFVRVWAELGRTHISLGGALELSGGSVVELDQAATAPIELFANGLCFANGNLVVTPEGTWGVQVQALT